MRIKEITLDDYIAFSFNNISHFRLRASSPIQVVIGLNGCGKSSLAREFNPKPAISTDFVSKRGMKQIIAEHNDLDYRITSDFKEASPHSFVRLSDGEELNVSGNANIQRDLMASVLGYTPIIHDLTQGVSSFADMAQGMRKSHLIDISPYNVELIVSVNKKCLSRLKEITGSLKLMHQRRDELLPKILSPEALLQLSIHKDGIIEDIDTINEQLYAIVPHLKRLIQMDSEFEGRILTEADIEEADDRLTDIMHEYYENIYGTLTYSDSDHGCIGLLPDDDDFIRGISELETQKAIALSRKTSLDEEISSLATDIDKYQSLMQEKKDASEDTSLQDKIIDLRDSLEKLVGHTTEEPLTRRDIDYWYTIEQKVFSLCNSLSDFRGKILSAVEVGSIGDELFYTKQQCENQQGYVDTLEKQHHQALHQFGILEDIGSVEECKKHDCVLLPSYESSYKNRKSTVDDLKGKLDQAKFVLNDLLVKKERLEETKRQIDVYRPLMNQTISICDLLPSLIEGVVLKDILNEDPFLLHSKMITRVTLSENTYRQREYAHELLLLEDRLKSKEELDKTNVSMIEELLETSTKKRQALIARQLGYDSQIALLDRYLYVRQAYKANITKIFDLQDRLEQGIAKAKIKEAIDHYTLIRSVLTDVKENYLEKLAQVTTTINEQDRLKARFEEEVNLNIIALEKERAEYILLEKASSPSSGLPHQYMVAVINTLIANTNRFIKRIFNYRLELNLLDINKPVDYKFSATVGENDVRVPDISTCSKSQKEVINFAFRLAALIQLNATDYPLILDEIGSGYDSYHMQRLLMFITELVNSGTVGQILLINHHAVLHEGLQDSEVLVLNPENIVVPSKYNEHVEMN